MSRQLFSVGQKDPPPGIRIPNETFPFHSVRFSVLTSLLCRWHLSNLGLTVEQNALLLLEGLCKRAFARDTYYLTVECGRMPQGPHNPLEERQFQSPITCEVIEGKLDLRAISQANRLIFNDVQNGKLDVCEPPVGATDRVWIFFYRFLIYLISKGSPMYKY